MELDLPARRMFTGPATIWKRALSFMFDIFIIDFFMLTYFRDLILSLVGQQEDAFSIYRMLEGNTAQLEILTTIFLLFATLALAYFVLSQYMIGQTAGQMLFNIKVVSDMEENPGLWKCLLRNIFIIPSVPFIFLWVIDPLYLVFARNGQRLTEWISGTKVVEQFYM